MNISGLIRSFVGGDLQAAEPKKLELKAGEVVKGVVQQQLPNDEAILNISGVQVRAKLETPLKQGEVTMLQVQPESSSEQIVLKPLSGSSVQIADSSMSELVKNIGLPDTAANRQLVQALHQAGIPLAKETIQAFAELQTKMPGTLKQEEWLPSAIIAFQKGVPLTPDSVSAVRQAITGPAFHETLRQLDTQITALLQGGEGLSLSSKSALEAFQQILGEMKSVSGQVMRPSDGAAALKESAEGMGNPVPGAGTSKGSDGTAGRLTASLDGAAVGKQANPGSLGGSTAAAGAAAAGALETAGADQEGQTAAGLSLPEAVEEAAAEPRRQGQAPPAGTAAQAASAGAAAAAGRGVPAAAPGGVTLQGHEPDPAGSGGGQAAPAAGDEGAAPGGAAPPRQEPVMPAAPQGSAGAGEAPSARRPDAAGMTPLASAAAAADLNDAEPAADTAGRASGTGGQEAAVKSGAAADSRTQASNPNGTAAADGSEGHWLLRLVKSLGIEHESSLFKLPEHGRSQALLPADHDGAGGGIPVPAQGQGSSPESSRMTETLKGALLQMMQADDIPASLKETAQQAVQHITGQQLLLNSDKASMFSHITLFVPLLNANGEQTAAIHIQSRKGKRGEIDARNCRLVFDLRMKTLGDTMVDVQVVDRIVSLQVHNNQPYIPALLEAHRDDIAASLSKIGYQFISLKCSPYPELRQAVSLSGDSDKRDTATVPVPLQSVYGSKPYRGMDVRV